MLDLLWWICSEVKCFMDLDVFVVLVGELFLNVIDLRLFGSWVVWLGVSLMDFMLVLWLVSLVILVVLSMYMD